MIVYQLVIISFLLVFTGIVLRNLFDLRYLPSTENFPGKGPFVSVLVPARNEEHNIRACIASLLAQDYDLMEIVVLDDGSTDRTLAILQELQGQAGSSRLKIIKGTPLAHDWHGKAWACQQLGHEAKGELLLFTDADTVHAPSSIRRAVAGIDESGADMLSLTPYQEMKTFAEHLVVPVIYFILICYLPLAMVSRSRFLSLCFANGQFIMFRRDMYQRIGGHASVRRDLVEDVWLCKAVKKAGGKVTIYNGTSTVTCRMYRNMKEIWHGFSKNLFAGLGYNTAGMFGLIIMTMMLYILPYFFLFYGLLVSEYSIALFWLPLFQIKLALINRVLIAVRFRQSLAGSLLHGLSQIALVAIAVNSFYLVTFGKGASWKGRRYNFAGRTP
ncbi:glycosyltransferase [Prosthecochloris sp. HL-130-GSB]|jgi:chlorobactene glucosyltransferase|uniref:glycosyltransferase n=1 Tax=Prosthecochloris sp. HL-130-GSB TaxID=1974213 RepID=UPI000A1C16A2|nr:glycosyltransferase [Prosthecochloris sp. HL-130-GSB]ARM31560.1 glycosyl hydrolase [Prosthecochloris sp. HL-130-GSB]